MLRVPAWVASGRGRVVVQVRFSGIDDGRMMCGICVMGFSCLAAWLLPPLCGVTSQASYALVWHVLNGRLACCVSS